MRFLNFIRRYKSLLILWVILVTVGRFDGVVVFFGHVFYVLELVTSCAVVSIIVRHVFMRYSLDAYSVEPKKGDSQFIKDWRMCDPSLKVVLAIVFFLAMYLGAAWIAASIAK